MVMTTRGMAKGANRSPAQPGTARPSEATERPQMLVPRRLAGAPLREAAIRDPVGRAPEGRRVVVPRGLGDWVVVAALGKED